MMDRMKKAAILISLAEKMSDNGSWCGETHIQKAVYLLEKLDLVQLNFDYVLYKYGPFSFELRDELASLRADELFHYVSQQPYGPRLLPTKESNKIKDLYKITLPKCEKAISFIAEKVGDKGVLDLEALTTALYVIKNKDYGAEQEIIKELRRLKPHITEETALAAVKEINQIIAEAGSLKTTVS